ncbi:MAG: GNAT family N-acetyltransferase [Roseiflexaceae bacterium]
MSAQPDTALHLNKLTIHRARIMDFPLLQTLLDDSAATLRVRYGIGPWGIATTIRQMERHMTDHHIMVISYMGVCVATFAVAPTPPSWYDMSLFSATPSAGYLYNMCVLPSIQQRGVGLWAIQRAHALAHNIGYHALWCHLYAEVSESHHFAHRAGYVWCGNVVHTRHVHYLCEHVLSQSSS